MKQWGVELIAMAALVAVTLGAWLPTTAEPNGLLCNSFQCVRYPTSDMPVGNPIPLAGSALTFVAHFPTNPITYELTDGRVFVEGNFTQTDSVGFITVSSFVVEVFGDQAADALQSTTVRRGNTKAEVCLLYEYDGCLR